MRGNYWKVWLSKDLIGSTLVGFGGSKFQVITLYIYIYIYTVNECIAAIAVGQEKINKRKSRYNKGTMEMT